MKVLLAHSYYRLPGGEDRYVDQLASLLRSDHKVVLLGRRNEELGGKLRTLERLFFSPKERDRVCRVIDECSPDIIHVHNVYPSLGPAVHLAAASRGIPLVMTVHNHRLRCPNGYMFTEGSTCSRCMDGAYFNAALHHCFPDRTQAAAYAAALWTHRYPFKIEDKVTLFVGVSNFMREQLVSWGMPSERVIAVRNFTDHRPRSSAPPAGRFGAYVGRISPEKGLDVLLKALESAGDPPFRIVGDGPQLQASQLLADRLGLRHTIFLGRLPPTQIADIMADSRFVAVPSLWEETSCLSGMEGLAGGRPLLVARIGALPELVQHGEGLSFEPGDVNDMAAKIQRLMEDDDLCQQAGQRGLELVRREFTPKVHLQRIEGAYERAIALHTKAAGAQ